MVTDSWSSWLVLLIIIRTIPSVICEVLPFIEVNETLVNLRSLLNTQGLLPGGFLSLRKNGTDILAIQQDRKLLPRDVVELTGKGSASLPAQYLESEWIYKGIWTSGRFSGNDSDPDAAYTVLDWRYVPIPALELQPGQSLTMRSMIWYAAYFLYPVSQALSDLSLDLILVPRNATLWLEDVVIMISCNDASRLLQSLCSSFDNWPYNPEVLVEGGVLGIRNLTSWAPWEGVRGAGGQIQWRNVSLTCPGHPGGGIPAPRPCVARPVNTAYELLTASRTALLEEKAKWVILSITSDIALLPEGGRWTPVPLNPEQHLILRGDPTARRTTLNLSGLADVWSLPGNRDMDTPPLDGAPMVLLYDLTLVNLPVYPTWPNGPMSLLAASLPCFGLSRGALWYGVEQIAVQRSAIVVPDMELHFLARIGNDQNFSDAWPGQPTGSFFVSFLERQSESDSSTGLLDQLHVQELKLMSEVRLTDCLLVSARSYQMWPDAAPLLTESTIWSPQLVAAQDPATVDKWGYGGLVVASGLQQALMDLAFCDSRPGYQPTRIILRHHDTTVPPLSSTPSPPINVLSTTGALKAADNCTVDGSSSDIGGGRVFSDLQGAVGRFSLVRPITLRNLVLYNLAPGGMVPTNVSVEDGNTTLSPSLQAIPIGDAAWKNSSLPLWFFKCARTAEELVYQPTAAELPCNSTSTPVRLPSRLVLENVTLVVPEREWRAMVAAILQMHAPDAMHAAQESGRRRQLDVFIEILDEGFEMPPFPPAIPFPPSPPPRPPPSPSPRPPSPPVSPPTPPSPPQPPPSPPYNEFTYEALMSFAAQSEVLSYNYSAGELVLAIAHHHGWSGTNVTITYKLPADAPGNATLLSYPDLVLPYSQLADMVIDFQANFTIRPLVKSMGPLLHDSSPLTDVPPSSTEGTQTSTSPISTSKTITASRRRHHYAWLAPLVASLSAAVGAALVIIPIVIIIRGGVMKTREESNGGAVGGSARCDDHVGRNNSLSTTVDERSSNKLEDLSVMQTVTREGPSVVEISCKSATVGFDAAASQHPPQQIPSGIQASLTSGQILKYNTTPGTTSSDAFSATKANRAALVEAFSKKLPNGPAPAVLDTEGGFDSGRGGGAVEGSAVTARDHMDMQAFSKELYAYYRALMASDPDAASPEILPEAEGTKTVQYGPVVKRNGPRNISDAIKNLQTTWKDKDLYLEHIIGCGASGAVYRGMWRGLPVAVKTLVVANDLEGKEGRARKQAVLEAAISLAMAHP
ncbi:hypothetical protein VaNZ11_015385, partial [Volvox africanus]